MIKEIPGYFSLSDTEKDNLFTSCIFVPDTNILLNLYRYSHAARSDWINSLKKIADNNQLWIPHQVILEYCRKRQDLIHNQKNALKDIKQKLSDIPDSIEKGIKVFQKDTIIPINYLSVIEEIKKSIAKLKEEIDKYDNENDYPNRFQNDDILKFIETTFQNKMGTPFSSNEIIEIFRKGEIRYKLRIPPGYCDVKKENYTQYGDLVIWYQILNQAKLIKKSIVFITAEEKEDWCLLDLKKNNSVIGPRPELVNEFYFETGTRFYLISGTQFINWLSSKNTQKVKKETLQESLAIESDNRDVCSLHDVLYEWNNLEQEAPIRSMIQIAAEMNKIQNSPLIKLAIELNKIQNSPLIKLATELNKIQTCPLEQFKLIDENNTKNLESDQSDDTPQN